MKNCEDCIHFEVCCYVDDVLPTCDSFKDKSKFIELPRNEIEHDLYEENGYIFGVELDLFNNHKYYYCKTIEDGKEYYQYLDGDIYSAIDSFNLILGEV